MSDNIEHNNNHSLPVYEAEIIYNNDEESKQIEKKREAVSPSIMQKLGMVASTIVTCIGFVSEIKSLFTGKKGSDTNCNSLRRQKRRFRRRR